MLNDGRAERDRGIDRVYTKNAAWMDDFIAWAAKLPKNWRGTGEDLRLMAIADIGRPTHPNAWGAAVNAAIRNKLLIKTGRHLQMRQTRSHARSTPEYQAAV